MYEEYEKLTQSLREKAEFLTVSDVQKAPPGLTIKNLFAETMREAADVIDSMRKIIASYEDRQRWIPVTERLPESAERYLVMRFDYVAKAPFYDLLWFENGKWWNRHFEGDYAVTNWMPLPDPPKEEDNA